MRNKPNSARRPNGNALIWLLAFTACAAPQSRPAGAAGVDAGGGLGAPAPGMCGTPNDQAGCSCDSLGTSRQCFVGDSGNADSGSCMSGTQTCITSDEFSLWSTCMPSDRADKSACGGGCTEGEMRSCYSGPVGTQGVGSCQAGVQTCHSNDWGPCEGEVTPTAEVCSDSADHNCNGNAGCADAQCATQPQCAQQTTTQNPTYCNAGGSVYVNNISYSDPAFPQIEVCSSYSGATTCESVFGTGGTFSANCAGSYQLCARLISNAACDIASTCISINVPTDNATVNLAPFPGFGPLGNACLSATYPFGSFSTSLDVSGTTTTGIAVNRPNLVTHLDPVGWGGGGNNGSGGGSF
jgi:hypothetical protein